MKKWISLILIALVSTLFWFFEVLYNNWEGLRWIEYFHIGYITAPVLFILWAVIFRIFNEITIVKLLQFIFIYLLGFFAFVLSVSAFFITGPSALFLYNDSTFIFRVLWLPVSLFVFVFTNVILIRTQIKKIDTKGLILILLGLLLIPVVAVLFSIPLLCYLFLCIYRDRNPSYILSYSLDPIHWFKTGSIILSTMIFEGYIFIHVNKRKKT